MTALWYLGKKQTNSLANANQTELKGFEVITQTSTHVYLCVCVYISKTYICMYMYKEWTKTLALQPYFLNQFMIFKPAAGSMPNSLQQLKLVFKRLCNTGWRGPRAAGPGWTSGGAAGAQPGTGSAARLQAGSGQHQGGMLHPWPVFKIVLKIHCNDFNWIKKGKALYFWEEIFG